MQQSSAPGWECPPDLACTGRDGILRANFMSSWAGLSFSYPRPGLKLIGQEPGRLNYIAWHFENPWYPGLFSKYLIMSTRICSLSLCSQSIRQWLFYGLDFMAVLHTSLKRNLGLPWFLFPTHSCEYSNRPGSRSCPILCTWPSHWRPFSIRISAMDGRPARSRISLLLTMSCHTTFCIALSCLIV